MSSAYILKWEKLVVAQCTENDTIHALKKTPTKQNICFLTCEYIYIYVCIYVYMNVYALEKV